MATDIRTLLGGDVMGEAMAHLPSAYAATGREHVVDVETRAHGLVRIVYERTRFRHNKSVGYYWSLKSAVAVNSDE